MNELQSARLALSALTVYRGAGDTEIFRLLRALLDSADGAPGMIRPFLECYGALTQYLYNTGTSLRSALEEAFLYNENAFTRAPEGCPPAVREAAAHDLGCLLTVRALTAEMLCIRAYEAFGRDAETREMVRALPPLPGPAAAHPAFEAGKTVQLVARLSAFHKQNGCGLFARYGAFTLAPGGIGLIPVLTTDPVCLADLRGYEYEHAAVLRHTQDFLAGQPTENLLLYGDRGTGKSSTVKAVWSELRGHGLRIIELRRADLPRLSALCAYLAGEPLRFILFLDDLSFAEDDEAFASLKAMLEGSVAARPRNVVLYATSNRRHLVRESFSERRFDDVNAADTQQEKLSLADRFGVTITFSAPDQALYLQIARELAERRGLQADPG